jgi:O-antigen/teichoic acid export membrane protein
MSEAAQARPFPKMQRSGVIFRNVMHIGLGQIASTALGFALTALLARMLGPADFGIYIIVFTIYGFVFVLIDWGQGTYVVSQIAIGRQDEPGFIATALLVRTAGTLCAAVAAAGIALCFGYRDTLAGLAPLMVFVGLPLACAQTLSFVFRGKDRMDVDALIAIAGRVVGLAATALLLHQGGKVFEVVVAWAIGGVAWLAAALFFMQRLQIRIGSPTSTEFTQQVRLGAPLAASAFVFALHALVDVWVLSRLSGPEVVGWYGAARAVIGFVAVPAAILAGASFPEVARAAGSVPELRRMLGINARVLLFIGAFAASVVFLLADYIVAAIYGRGQFEKTTQLVRVSMPFLPLLSVGFLLGNATAAVGRMKEVALAKVVFMVGTTLIAWFPIGYCQAHFGNGAIAIMAASGVAEFWMLLCFAYLLPRGAVTWSMALDIARALGVMACALLPVWALHPLSIWLQCPLSVALFGAAAWALGLVRESDIEKIRQLLFKRNTALSQPPA